MCTLPTLTLMLRSLALTPLALVAPRDGCGRCASSIIFLVVTGCCTIVARLLAYTTIVDQHHCVRADRLQKRESSRGLAERLAAVGTALEQRLRRARVSLARYAALEEGREQEASFPRLQHLREHECR